MKMIQYVLLGYLCINYVGIYDQYFTFLFSMIGNKYYLNMIRVTQNLNKNTY